MTSYLYSLEGKCTILGKRLKLNGTVMIEHGKRLEVIMEESLMDSPEDPQTRVYNLDGSLFISDKYMMIEMMETPATEGFIVTSFLIEKKSLATIAGHYGGNRKNERYSPLKIAKSVNIIVDNTESWAKLATDENKYRSRIVKNTSVTLKYLGEI